MPSRSSKDMPGGTDGQAHLFFAQGSSPQFMAISTNGCIAIQTPGNPLRVAHWYFRAKGNKLITLDSAPWCILWSCRAPWNTEPCGHITRLHVVDCGLANMNVRGLTRLAHLRCRGNPLERLDCSGMEHLRSLDCSGNELACLNVDGCIRLKSLFVAGNRRLRAFASDLLARARGEPCQKYRKRLTSTSLFDL